MTDEKTKEDVLKPKPWIKNRPASHLDRWAELLKDPKVKEEWEALKKEKLKELEKKGQDNAIANMYKMSE
jgi:hypothetical protein